MHRLTKLSLAATLFVAAGYTSVHAIGTVGPPPAPCDSDSNVPVLMYEVAGWGFGGPIHQRLTVYSNGTASYTGGTEGKFTFVPQEAIKALRKNLREANAHNLCDIQEFVSDLPQTHVTVFQGTGADLRAHIYTYFTAATPDHQKVELLVHGFIATWFPPTVIGG